MNAIVAYNPNDPEQARFLAALAIGETGRGSGSQWLGYGGIDLSNAPRDQYGFPQWAGADNSHAAGTYQFQPRTWADVAQRYGLNFESQADQSAGAWYLAEETYYNRTGRSLDADLDNGEMSYLETALHDVWPSVTGNQAAPRGLVQTFLNGISDAFLATLGLGPFANMARGMGQSIPGVESGVATVTGFFQRAGLIVLGGIVVFVALWFILGSTGIVESPGKVVKAVAGSARSAA